MGKEEVKRLFGIFLSKEKGGLTTHELAELIYADHADIFKDDTEIHDLLLDALLSARTKGDLTQYENRVIELRNLQSSLNMFKTKIRYTYAPLPEIFTEIAENAFYEEKATVTCKIEQERIVDKDYYHKNIK